VNLPQGVAYFSEAQAAFAVYVVDTPAAGAWKLLNIRRQDNGPVPEAVRFVALDPNVVAQFGTDRGPAAIGRKLRLYARLLEGGAPLGDASVTVKLISPEESVGTLVVQHLTHPQVADRIKGQLPKDRIMGRRDVLIDYKRQHQLAALPTTLATLDLGPVATGYFQVEFTPTKEGTYTFEFHAEGKTKSNQAFHRTYSLSKYVSFSAAPEKTRIKVAKVGVPKGSRRGVKRYKITVIPTARSGQLMGPFNPSRLAFYERGRPIPFEIRDAMDGSYEAFIVLTKDSDRADIRMRIGNVEFPQSPLIARRRGILGLLRR
jgi:hypothetical protein